MKGVARQKRFCTRAYPNSFSYKCAAHAQVVSGTRKAPHFIPRYRSGNDDWPLWPSPRLGGVAALRHCALRPPGPAPRARGPGPRILIINTITIKPSRSKPSWFKALRFKNTYQACRRSHRRTPRKLMIFMSLGFHIDVWSTHYGFATGQTLTMPF